jgi:hypothetical protein
LEDTVRVSEKIFEEVTKLPEPLQAEVLDFVHYLASKVSGEAPDTDEPSCAVLSLAMAMRGMEDEDTPGYTIEDLREKFT